MNCKLYDVSIYREKTVIDESAVNPQPNDYNQSTFD